MAGAHGTPLTGKRALLVEDSMLVVLDAEDALRMRVDARS